MSPSLSLRLIPGVQRPDGIPVLQTTSNVHVCSSPDGTQTITTASPITIITTVLSPLSSVYLDVCPNIVVGTSSVPQTYGTFLSVLLSVLLRFGVSADFTSRQISIFLTLQSKSVGQTLRPRHFFCHLNQEHTTHIELRGDLHIHIPGPSSPHRTRWLRPIEIRYPGSNRWHNPSIVIPLIIILLFIGCRRRRRRHDTADTFAASEMVSPLRDCRRISGEKRVRSTRTRRNWRYYRKQQSLRSNTPEAGVLEKVDFSPPPRCLAHMEAFWK
ncbi:hypothetical protein B0H13DRAFT_2365418 [Mycena leptocephala]|nr:hypothetical protein B0H13DRAFT_2365418 [Mycena leptocephala]